MRKLFSIISNGIPAAFQNAARRRKTERVECAPEDITCTRDKPFHQGVSKGEEYIPENLSGRPIHYRSRLYTSHIGMNSLVIAAHPIFSILERIKLSEKLPNVDQLHHHLSHELQAFTAHVKTSEHTEETILLARYLLCAVIDEIIEKAYQKKETSLIQVSPQQQPKLVLNSWQQDENQDERFHFQAAYEDRDEVFNKGEKLSIRNVLIHETESLALSDSEIASSDTYFFQILEKTMAKPDFYLDLIELTYLCLITGFEGKYRLLPDGKQKLERLLDTLYQMIQTQKPSSIEKLFIIPISARRFILMKPFPWKRLTAALIILIITAYLSTNYLINQEAANVIQKMLGTSINTINTPIEETIEVGHDEL